MDKAKKSKTPKKKRPLRRAQHWGSQVPAMAGRMLVTLIAVCAMGLMFSALQAISMLWLRALISLSILLGMALIYVNDGVGKGAGDAAASRYYVSAKERGLPLEQKDDAACYNPLKAVCAALAAFGVPLVLSVIVSLMAKEYTYVMQDLPGWLTDSYGARGDVMAPLGAYSVHQGMELLDWARLLVRMPILMMVNFFPDVQAMSATIDRLSPLMIAVYPLAYVLGYLLGPKTNRKRETQNRRAKKIAVRRTQKSNLVEELTGERPQVHYGHKKEEENKHKKKELV